MKKRFALGLALALIVVGSTALMETYRVTVTRKEANLYQIGRTKTYIKTKYCYEYAYSEDAILRYDRGAYDNKLIFDKRPGVVASCDVEKLLTED